MNQTKYKLSELIQFTDKQKAAHKYIGTGMIVFWGGARGCGKSHFALAEAVLQCRKHPGLVAVIIRESYPELERNFIFKLQPLFPPEIWGYQYKTASKTAMFSNGSMIMLQSIETEKDLNKVQGVEYQFMIIDEAPKNEADHIEKLRGSLRRSDRLPDFIPTLLMTGNPGGKSDLYFKTRFVSPNYTYWHENELKLKDKYIFIPAFVSDNPHVPQEYTDYLESLHPELRDKWLLGKWDIYEGAFFQEWNEEVHVCASFEIPQHWYRVAAIDEGWSKKHPAVELWLAQDPETMTVYVYREYVQRGNTDQYARDTFNLQAGEDVRNFADPSFFYEVKRDEAYTETSAAIFARNGVSLEKANNSRVDGWRIVKDWLHWTTRRDPKLKIFETCRQLINTFPTLTYAKGNKDDLDTTQQDDAADALRYALVSGFGYQTAREVDEMEEVNQWEEESKEAMQKFEDEFTRIGYDTPVLRPKPGYVPSRYREKRYVSSASFYL